MTLQTEKDKFLSLILENKRIIYKVCQSYCKDAADREDLLQEIIIQLWKSAGNYEPKYKLSTWIYQISLNVAISFYRRETRWKRDTAPLHENIIDLDEGAPELTERAHDIDLLYGFIDKLDELNKALILLYLDDQSYKEISCILGITETNVATKLNRIKQKLKNDFATLEIS